MVCLYCGAKTKVKNSRLQKKLNQVWRRRECLNCKAIFTTEEMIEHSNSWQVSKNAKSTAPFNRDMLFLSIYESCKHRKKAISDAASLTESVMTRLMAQSKNGNFDVATINQVVLVVLNRFDKAAAIHYQSYHN